MAARVVRVPLYGERPVEAPAETDLFPPIGFTEEKFTKAIDWFREQVPVTRATWDRLDEWSRRFATRVSGVAQLDLVADTLDAVKAAIENGTTLEDFKKAIGPALERAWDGTVENPPWRLETIFRTNVQNAYGAGRWEQQHEPDTMARRPYLAFSAILDGRETPQCHALHGTIRPADDPWWEGRVPPLRYNCRSGTISLTAKQALARGGVTAEDKLPKVEGAEGFGGIPGTDEWSPDPQKYAAQPELWEAYKAKVERSG